MTASLVSSWIISKTNVILWTLREWIEGPFYSPMEWRQKNKWRGNQKENESSFLSIWCRQQVLKRLLNDCWRDSTSKSRGSGNTTESVVLIEYCVVRQCRSSTALLSTDLESSRLPAGRCASSQNVFKSEEDQVWKRSWSDQRQNADRMHRWTKQRRTFPPAVV